MYEFLYNAGKDAHDRNIGSALKSAEDLGYLYGLRKDYKAAKQQLENDIEGKADTAEMAAAKKNLPIKSGQLAEKTARMKDLQEQKNALLQQRDFLKQKIAAVESGSVENAGEEQ